MNKHNKKGVLDDFLVEFGTGLFIVIAGIIFFFFAATFAAFAPDTEVTQALAAHDVTLTHLAYLKTATPEGTIDQLLIRISMEDNERERQALLSQLQEHTELFIEPYASIFYIHELTLQDGNTLELGQVEPTSREDKPTLTSRTVTHSISIPTPTGTITHTASFYNIHDITPYNAREYTTEDHLAPQDLF